MVGLQDFAITVVIYNFADLVVVGQVWDATEGLDLICFKIKFTFRLNIFEDVDLLIRFLLSINDFLNYFIVSFNFSEIIDTVWKICSCNVVDWDLAREIHQTIILAAYAGFTGQINGLPSVAASLTINTSSWWNERRK